MSLTPVLLDNASDTLVIHLQREGFADFVKGLLGQPQTMESEFLGAFDIGKREIQQLYHLVDQRVRQQNKAALTQFSIRINYDNNSSVLLNSIEDFERFDQIEKKVPIAAKLTWSYLIQFEDRVNPEQQEIEVAMRSTAQSRAVRSIHFPTIVIDSQKTGFSLEIRHTARTWANDIENLLGAQLRTWIIESPWYSRLLFENSGWVALLVSIGTLSLCALGGAHALSSMQSDVRLAMEAALALADPQKIDYVIRELAILRINRIDNVLIGALLLSTFASVLIGATAGVLADNPAKSYLVLSEDARIAKERSERRRRKGFAYFFLTCLSGIVAGFCSRYLFVLAMGTVTL